MGDEAGTHGDCNSCKEEEVEHEDTGPNCVRPSNLEGMTERTKATPPVDMVLAYHAKVKCLSRSFKVTFPAAASSFSSCKNNDWVSRSYLSLNSFPSI
jgi:hypothetical protein